MKAPSPDYAIGDVVPMPEDADMVAAAIAMDRRRITVRNASRGGGKHGHHPAVKAAMLAIAGAQDSARRQADPFERARTFLRQRGFVPVALVDHVHLVGRQRFTTEAEVMDFARGKGWRE